jgi:hypothetical protein
MTPELLILIILMIGSEIERLHSVVGILKQLNRL